jgi:DNA-binding response OmpR family regulator
MTSILLATDAQWIVEELTASLESTDVTLKAVSEGRSVLKTVTDELPDLVILDMQLGSMGGVAIALDIRADEGMDRIPHVPILMLLDRRADVFLSRRAQVDGFLVKPIEPLRLRKAVNALLDGESYEDPSYSPEQVQAPNVIVATN